MCGASDDFADQPAGHLSSPRAGSETRHAPTTQLIECESGRADSAHSAGTPGTHRVYRPTNARQGRRGLRSSWSQHVAGRVHGLLTRALTHSLLGRVTAIAGSPVAPPAPTTRGLKRQTSAV